MKVFDVAEINYARKTARRCPRTRISLSSVALGAVLNRCVTADVLIAIKQT